jgi:hypothetical protein
VTVRPLLNLLFGPVGLFTSQHLHSQSTQNKETVIPNNNRSLLILSHLKRTQLCNKGLRRPIIHKLINLLITKRNLLLRCITWGQQISDCKKKEKKLDRAPHRIVLVAALDVSQDDGRAGHFVELRVRVIKDAHRCVLEVCNIHGGLNKQSQIKWGLGTIKERDGRREGE